MVGQTRGTRRVSLPKEDISASTLDRHGVDPTILSLTASEAAQESEGPELRFESEAEYIGPVFDDDALRQRQGRRESSAGLIDVYNVWTSFQKVNLKSNLM